MTSPRNRGSPHSVLTEMSSASLDTDAVPSYFRCPITGHCMCDPVVLSDGHSYERTHIVVWLEKNSTSPVTGDELKNVDLFPNTMLREAIDRHFQQAFSDDPFGNDVDMLGCTASLSNASTTSTETGSPRTRSHSSVSRCDTVASDMWEPLEEELEADFDLVEGPFPSKHRRRSVQRCSRLSFSADLQRYAIVNGKIAEILSQASTGWDFDVFSLAEHTDNKPLSTLAGYLFDQSNLADRLGFDRVKLGSFLAELERGHSDSNAFHNRARAASVLHATHVILQQGGLAELAAETLCPGSGGHLERAASLLAACIWGYEHKGLSNEFLVRVGDERAVRYNDCDVNEQHCAAAAFRLLRDPQFNFVRGDTCRRLRSLVLEIVLEASGSCDERIRSRFANALDLCLSPSSPSEGLLLRNESLLSLGESEAGSDDESAEDVKFAPCTSEHATLLLQMVLKCADLHYLATDWNIHVQWIKRLETEYFAQGDLEEAAGLPISKFMDRRATGIVENQGSFFASIGMPTLNSFARAVPAVQPMVRAAARNHRRWCVVAQEQRYPSELTAMADRRTDVLHRKSCRPGQAQMRSPHELLVSRDGSTDLQAEELYHL